MQFWNKLPVSSNCLHPGVCAKHQAACRWIQSEPFDVGMATTNAFGSANPSGPSGAAKMMEEASWKNQDSKANGALMRIAPLAIFGCYLPLPSLTAMAEQDARLSHPNKTCLSCNAAYCAALGHLIAHPGDAPGAIAVATAVAERPDFEPEVRQWLVVDSLGEPAGLNCEQMIGFCRWGFTLAFMWLRKGSRCVLATHPLEAENKIECSQTSSCSPSYPCPPPPPPLFGTPHTHTHPPLPRYSSSFWCCILW